MQEIDYTIPRDGEEFRIVKSGYVCGKVELSYKTPKKNIAFSIDCDVLRAYHKDTLFVRFSKTNPIPLNGIVYTIIAHQIDIIPRGIR